MNENEKNQIKNIKYQIIGWVHFIICAILFLASGLVNNDILTLMGSVIFLIACIVFLIPLFSEYKTATDIAETNEIKQ